MTTNQAPTRELLERAVASQEGLRSTLGDEIVDATIAALRSQMEVVDAASEAGPRRRMATVIFVDVVDSTALLRDRDPEETMQIMDSALERLAGPIADHGGRVTRFMGDGYLAVFGLPVSRENDPEMAVRAGLAVQVEAASIAGDLRRAHGIDFFAVRVGINTGLVVSGGTTEAQDTIMGAEVNLAARLESAAPPGGVLISHGTLQHVRDRCSVEARGEIEAKGFAAPVPVYLVLAMADERRRGARPIVEGIETAFIGRDGELMALRDAFIGARATGSLRVISISGEAGTGKSRLVREFEDTLPAAARRFRARVGPEDRDVPYGLIRDLLTRCFDLRIGDSSDEVHRKLVAGMASAAEGHAEERAMLVGRLAGFEVGDPADDPQQLRDRALSYLAGYLRPLPDQPPAVLVAEDLQWADEASLGALSQIGDRLDSTATVLIAAARPEFWAGGLGSALDRHRIDLGPLDDRAAELLVDAALRNVDGETFALRRLLLAGAEGNPYFLEEIIRMLVDDGVLGRSGAGWTVESAGLTDLRVPPTLSGVVQARLDALDPSERSTVQRASVIGRVFWKEAVERLGGGPADDAIASLVRRDMAVAHEVSAFADTVEYAFRHNVLREVAYESVLLDDRKALHGLTADWLLEHAGERSGEMNGLIATHLEKADRGSEALDYLIRAGEAARSGYAVATAADFYDRALALVPPSDLLGRFDLLFGRQELLGLQGDRSGQERVLNELDTLAEALGDAERQARVAVERTWVGFYRSDFAAALAAASRGAELAAGIGNAGLESRARSALAWAHLTLDEFDRAEHHGRLALALAEQDGNLEYEAAARNALGMLSLARGDPSEGSAHLMRALALARRVDQRSAESTYLNNLAVARMLLGDFDGAWGHFTTTLDLAEAAGDLSGAASAYTNLAWVAGSRGEWATACDMARRALPMKQREGHREAEAETLLWLGHALTGLHRTEEALEAYRLSLLIREDLGQTALALGVRAGMARAHLAAGDIGAAIAHVDRILEHLDGGGSLDGSWEPMRIHLTCVDVLEAAGDRRRDHVLERAAATLEERAARISDPADRQMLLEAVPWHRRLVELAATGEPPAAGA